MPKEEEKKEKEEIKIEEIKPEIPEIEPEKLEGIEEPVRIELLKGLFKAVSVVPTHTPKHFSEQIVFYKSGSTYRLYCYIKDAWKEIGGLTYEELDPPEWGGQANFNTWEDWDLSATIPAGAKYAEIVFRSASASLKAGVRKNGSSVDRTIEHSTGTSMEVYHMTVEVDANRIIERYSQTDPANWKFTVVGYWK